jgi:16S rRNA (guanine966-N2)-methyltransferase
MRIIGGNFKGKKIHPPKIFKSRPTTDFAKEALFNILQNDFNIPNIDVLDLFAGTGSISYEFCSRNCKSLIALDIIKSNTIFIENKCKELNFLQAKVINIDAFKFMKTCVNKFDVIFADPPFEMENIEDIYSYVFNNNLLSNTSYLIIEHGSNIDFSDKKHFYMKKKYGKVNFSFFDPDK